jgi:hypothetical protein
MYVYNLDGFHIENLLLSANRARGLAKVRGLCIHVCVCLGRGGGGGGNEVWQKYEARVYTCVSLCVSVSVCDIHCVCTLCVYVLNVLRH